jgi:hypothetical protein
MKIQGDIAFKKDDFTYMSMASTLFKVLVDVPCATAACLGKQTIQKTKLQNG